MVSSGEVVQERKSSKPRIRNKAGRKKLLGKGYDYGNSHPRPNSSTRGTEGFQKACFQKSPKGKARRHTTQNRITHVVKTEGLIGHFLDRGKRE